MKKIREVKLSLSTLMYYEPDAYLDEISEIFNCIMENRIYDEAPRLSQQDLIILLEGLEGRSPKESNRLDKLKKLVSRKEKISEEVESALRAKIRRILLGS